ncbi:MAG: cytochrome c biogenesis protein CcsA [Nitrospinota bacterium]|nr:cytochrome c biogenesis protein CcsA [Nitrospinota bacterium]
MKILMALAAFCYFLGMVKFFLHLAVKRQILFYLATAMIVAGFLFHTGMMFKISSMTGHGPYTTPFEQASFFSWTIMGMLIVAIFFSRVTALGVFVSPIGFLVLAYSFLLPMSDNSQLTNNEYWLTLHLTLSFLALSSFVVIFAASIMYLMQERQLKSHHLSGIFKRMPDLQTLDTVFHKSLIFGFPLITVGMGSAFMLTITKYGSLLGPKPGRILPLLIIWAVYAVIMIGRSLLGWRGHEIALMGLVGFAGAMAALGIHLYF